MVIKALLEASIKGTGKFGRTSIFPCGIFEYKKGINDKPGTPNYDLKMLALESTSKRLYPNYANCDWSNQTKAVNTERKNKQQVIDELSDSCREKLIERLKGNTELQEKLYLNEDLSIMMEERPIEQFSTMGCRTCNLLDINFLNTYRANIKSVIETGKMKYDMISGIQKDGRGNICPVTIILPEIAMLAKQSAGENATKPQIKMEFINLLTKKLDEARDMLIERFKHICEQSANSAKFMYENHTMCGYNKEEGIISALKHGTVVIGQLGLAETLQILIGCDQTKPEGMELAKEIEALYNVKCTEYKKDYSLNFGVYYSPSENLCFTSFKKFKNKWGDIENVTYFINDNGEKEDKKYFTNSIHIPVYIHVTPFEKIDIESQLTGYSNAGCITYVELKNDVVNNIEALEKIVDYAMDHDIPYLGLNMNSDQCEDCGYQGYIPNECPKCKSNNISRLRRVTGYLTGDYKTAFNEGKICETEDRVKHIKEVKFD